MDIYSEITKRIIDEMEGGVIPWQKPWLSVLRNDKRFIVLASGKAEKAVSFILGSAG